MPRGRRYSWEYCSIAVADRRAVHDGQKLGQVIGQHRVVEHLVAVVQLLHVDVLGQVTGMCPQLLVGPLGLLQWQDSRRQPTVKPSASRSAAVNATPRLRSGSSRTPGVAGVRAVVSLIILSLSAFTSLRHGD
jgi:hypothetical protein